MPEWTLRANQPVYAGLAPTAKPPHLDPPVSALIIVGGAARLPLEWLTGPAGPNYRTWQIVDFRIARQGQLPGDRSKTVAFFCR